MPLHKTLAFLELFPLSLVTIATSIARVADISATAVPGSGFNPRFLWLWTAVEPCISKCVNQPDLLLDLVQFHPRICC